MNSEQTEPPIAGSALDAAGLVYSTDAEPGILRRPCGRGFAYLGADGLRLDSAADRARIAKLGIPPAYRDVWICARPDGHLQATGFDDRRRKQYRYHADWSALRARLKFGDLAGFGRLLPRIRRSVAADLREPAGSRSFGLAALVTLIDVAGLRVGSEAYAKENRSFGATTLRRRHFALADGVVRLKFRGKGGRRVQLTLRDRRLHRIFEEIDDLPGRNLFVFLSDDGAVQTIDSAQVNRYLVDVSGQAGVSAKTFRTWAGTLAAYRAVTVGGARTVKAISSAAAENLHNTPTICRKSYIHPDVLALAGPDPPAPAEPAPPIRGLRGGEAELLRFLEGRETAASAA